MARRLADSAALARGPAVTITLDGHPVPAHAGESVAAVMLVQSAAVVRLTPGGEPRGVYCGMGVCFDCLVTVDDVPNSRACMTWVVDGMDVRRQSGWAS